MVEIVPFPYFQKGGGKGGCCLRLLTALGKMGASFFTGEVVHSVSRRKQKRGEVR